jgi:hypothetical protein
VQLTGISDGVSVGLTVGIIVGLIVGMLEGVIVGCIVGRFVGFSGSATNVREKMAIRPQSRQEIKTSSYLSEW